MPSEKNKVKYDLKAAYYAVVTEQSNGSLSYGSPVKLNGAVSISLSPEGDNEIFRADGAPYVITNTNSGYSGDLELALVPEEFEKACLGAREENGIVTEYQNSDPTPFALLFEINGDKKSTRHAFYYCVATRHTIEAENPDSRSPQTETISITAIPRPTDGLVKAKTCATTTDGVYGEFFTAVPDPATLTAT